MTADRVSIARALLSVSDKTGLIELARALDAQGVALLSTGGTAQALRDAGLAVTDVSDHTGFPEIMDGRVKTLHPKIHGGLLGRRDIDSHTAAMAEHGIAPIDLLVVNLYPFEQTVAGGADFATCVENIDIGGPALIRAAAKNHPFVTVLCDPNDYADFAEALSHGQGTTDLALRRRLAAKAYAHTAAYDSAIANWMGAEAGDPFPERALVAGVRRQMLRYGENPHQRAAFYTLPGSRTAGVATAEQAQGKELSYNNLNDTDAAFQLVSEFQAPRFAQPAIAIIKHANPCGVALGEDLLEAWQRALACDPVSAFGGVIAANRPLDGPTAEAIAELFVEVVIAPGATEDARDALAKKSNLRLLLTDGVGDAEGMTLRTVAGGLLIQDADARAVSESDLKVVTKRAPSDRELADLLFAFAVAKHVKSNAIVYAKNGATVGMGAGQMSRVDSARIAALKSDDAAA
ncbi:MAG: bifunctional phosphoribosylaminoimidazolecarboxamide formyltransferase/IMP cyclohydrolase, partial [Alphaproteobacteria bacterium]|nr:bifunctional phosphoribosylaminoimidazolecarboxamide formyltransferase/IMP cyclohydrolase [Alphaproteobacteria bacterium]